MGQLMFIQWDFVQVYFMASCIVVSLGIANFLLKVWRTWCRYDETQQIENFFKLFGCILDIYGVMVLEFPFDWYEKKSLSNRCWVSQ